MDEWMDGWTGGWIERGRFRDTVDEWINRHIGREMDG